MARTEEVLPPGASLQSPLKTSHPALHQETEKQEVALEELKTPRSSFYTFFSELPPGVPIPPNFRTHSRYVLRFGQALEHLDEQEVEKVVLRARAWW